MTRLPLAAAALGALMLTPGCIALTAADLAIDATGAVDGAAGDVVEGAVDVITPGKAAPEDKPAPATDETCPD